MAKTKDNLLKAFGEASESVVRYLAFAEAAEQEKKPGAAKIFRAVAKAKSVHGAAFFRDAGLVDITMENLRQAQDEETYDYKTLYPSMIPDAVNDGAETARHSLEYGMSIGPIIARMIAKALGDPDAREEGSYYICPLCGNIEFGKPPGKCPFCGVDGSKFVEVI